MPKVLIATNTAWNLFNFRAGLIRGLVAAGYEVVAISPQDEYVSRLMPLDCRFVALSLDNRGKNPGRDLLFSWRFFRLLRRERPDIYLGYTIKPNVYGSLAAHALRIPVINNIAGLGTVFSKDNWLTRLVRGMYKLALLRSDKVFFQNDDDRKLFVGGGLVDQAVTDLLPGSGVDLTKFSLMPPPERSRLQFLLLARMLWDKGVGEFVAAARFLKRKGIKADFCLLGFVEVENPGAIPRKQINSWVDEGVVSYLGVSDDVRVEIAAADCIVLPSYYREGTPRALLEAAALGRPIITTDSVGCRDVVDDGVNGYLCRPRDADDLAEKMARMAELLPADREVMGKRGREKVEREFDEQIVINKYLEAVQAVVMKVSTRR